ncbi:hypothetical protein [Sphingobium boeckii]|uniref:Anti-sigma factor NepR domain-containing protein n=1 Tax=Sphingobium boeckii TaxID=1082345 RepID=A0A7W9AH14_9SPHN|nr:hypothetical protein [Sphingobium boeckii]MBB5685423.1 hypothetical protein [Sphingobium boeckii]
MSERLHHHRAMENAQVLVTNPSPSDGVGNALRSAFRGRLKNLPPDMAALLSKLDN